MKILIVTQYYFPENFKSNDLSFELQKRGHDVTVLTGLPNYRQTVDAAEKSAGLAIS